MIHRIRAAGVGVAAVGLALLATGCAVGPDYEEPQYDLPDAWQSAAATDLADTLGTPLVTWWSAFGDTLLDALLVEARAASPSLAAAAGRIREAHGLRRAAGGDRWPQVQANGQWSRTKLSDSGGGAAVAALGGSNPSSNWEFGLGASWEVDLFGRTRRQVEAADAGLAASVEDYRDALVSLQAQVAATYIEVRALQERLVYARQNADSQRETLGLVEARLDAGLVPALDVARARSNLANTLATIPALEISLEVASNQLAILLGRMPGSLDARLEQGAAVIPAPATDIAAGLPADLLRRRPDVRRSERQLAAQTARIGVATADLYPRFSISGLFGLQAGQFSDLGKDGSTTWSLVPGFSWNLFTGGKVRGLIEAEEGRTEQALAAYEATVLGALAEVENALVALRQEEERRDALGTAVTAGQEAVELVHTQYLSGLTDFQAYLDAQRSLAAQQDQFAASRGLVVANLIQLNRALGGGWSLEDPVPVLSQNDVNDDAPDAGDEPKEEVNR